MFAQVNFWVKASRVYKKKPICKEKTSWILCFFFYHNVCIYCLEKMKQQQSAYSIVEALVVMVMISLGLSGLFWIFSESQKLSNSTEQRIQAIQIAREWIEAFENIRDTNALLYRADLKNCWNVENYNSACFWDDSIIPDIGHEVSYSVTQDSSNRWMLNRISKWTSNDEFNDLWYRDDFRVQLDSDWFYTQSWSGTNTSPVFTRELFVEYIEDTDGIAPINSNDEKMRVTSIVQWNDSAWDIGKRIELVSELTNWRNYE